MDVDASGARFSAAELDAIVSELARVARVFHVTALGGPVAYLAAVAGAVAERATREAQAPMMTVKEFANAHGMPERTVRHQCQTGRLNARKRDHKWFLPVNSHGNPQTMPTPAA